MGRLCAAGRRIAKSLGEFLCLFTFRQITFVWQSDTKDRVVQSKPDFHVGLADRQAAAMRCCALPSSADIWTVVHPALSGFQPEFLYGATDMKLHKRGNNAI